MSTPKLGSKAPSFSLPDQRGQTVSLADYSGKPFVLYFYPKDDTPGCTKEACGFRDNWDAFETAGIDVVGISPDSPASHTKFMNKYDLPFTLLADEDHAICEAYGVWGTKKFRGREYMGVKRTTFVIDGDGKISHVYENVKPSGHSQQLLEALTE
ncbi:MAG: thioredoxin-dependent thiol peroxidase [Anaerolineales bacterium]